MSTTDTKSAYGEVETGTARSEGGGVQSSEQPLPPAPKAEPAKPVLAASEYGPGMAEQTAPAEELDTTKYAEMNRPQQPATIERLPETSRAIDTWEQKHRGQW